jgi:hypothetical protein
MWVGCVKRAIHYTGALVRFTRPTEQVRGFPKRMIPRETKSPY